MKWYYESNGLPQGPVSETELRILKEEGKLVGAALVWSKGMVDWAPLETISEFSSAPHLKQDPESKLPQLFANVSTGKAPRKELDQAYLQPQEVRDSTLPTSKETDAGDHNHDLILESPADVEVKPEWEHVQETGPLGAFILSLKEILLDPSHTFHHLPKNGGWGLPLSFLLIAEFIGNVLMILTVRQVPTSGSPASAFLRQVVPVEGGNALLLYSVVASVCILPMAVVVKAGLLHLPMKVLARSHQSFATTFRTLCYSLGAGGMLWGIPLTVVSLAGGEEGVSTMGLFLSMAAIGIWSLYVNLRALASAHEVSFARAASAVLLLPLLIGLFFILLFGVLGVVS